MLRFPQFAYVLPACNKYEFGNSQDEMAEKLQKIVHCKFLSYRGLSFPFREKFLVQQLRDLFEASVNLQVKKIK